MEKPLFRLFLLKALFLLPSTTLGTKLLAHWDTQDPNSSSNHVTVCTVLHTRGTVEMSSLSKGLPDEWGSMICKRGYGQGKRCLWECRASLGHGILCVCKGSKASEGLLQVSAFLSVSHFLSRGDEAVRERRVSFSVFPGDYPCHTSIHMSVSNRISFLTNMFERPHHS